MGRKGRVMPKEDSYNAFSDASSLRWEKNSWLSYQRWEKGPMRKNTVVNGKISLYICVSIPKNDVLHIYEGITYYTML